MPRLISILVLVTALAVAGCSSAVRKPVPPQGSGLGDMPQNTPIPGSGGGPLAPVLDRY